MNYKMLKWNSSINALIFLLLGLLLLIFPIESISIGGYLIASILMLGGIGYLIRIYKERASLTNRDIIYIILSIVAIGVSISIFVNPTWIIRVINILVGLILLISGLINLNNILKFRKNRTTSWWIYISLIGIIVLLGILIIVNPLWLAKVITRLAGVALIIDTLITMLLTKKVSKYLMIEEKTE
ncbi:MAG: DUF308 domain-containing protein [Bacilli bacterium]|nr:DUF308 domain-containing protein [Bacilli bacterium]